MANHLPFPVQVVIPSKCGPERYESSGAFRLARPPCRCPNCDSVRRLRFHGYYERQVSSELTGKVIHVHVRRFFCRDCRRTTSLLPWFAQPYRLVRNQVIAEYLREGTLESCDLRWQSLLGHYRKKFEGWLPELEKTLGREFGLKHLGRRPALAWRTIETRLGGITLATALMAALARITIFGKYTCHLPCGIRSLRRHDHTTVLFASGTDPPK